MDQKKFAERVLRLKEVGDAVDKLPPEIRSSAFDLLKDYVSGTAAVPSGKSNHQSTQNHSDGGDLFLQFNHEKPSDNVRLIAASLYQEYGSEPFSVEEIKAVAADAGVTVPGRVDMTLNSAVEKGRQLFASVGRGFFKPTVHGEAYLKTTYGVKKGTKKRDPESA